MIDRLVLKRTDHGFREEAPLDLANAKRHGRERVVRCPFHPDESPSLWVNLDKLCFHCFACEASGVVAAEGSLPTLVRPDVRKKEPTRDHHLQLERHRILDDALRFYQQQLERAAFYLQSRAVSLQLAQTWRAGFCPYEVSSFVEHMKQRGWDLDGLFRHGLLRPTPSGKLTASLKGRVVFPLTHEGHLSNLAGRQLQQRTSGVKWLFLKNIQSIPKGIFAESNLGQSRVILLESIFDALPWLERGRPAVALMGVQLPDWVVRRLRDKEVYFALNGDDAGERATHKQLACLEGVVKEIRWIHLPVGYKDWNEYHCDRHRALGRTEAP